MQWNEMFIECNTHNEGVEQVELICEMIER